MSYKVTKFDAEGRKVAELGNRPTVTAARNLMIEDANGYEPNTPPFHCPELKIVEGWFIGSTEYNIELV